MDENLPVRFVDQAASALLLVLWALSTSVAAADSPRGFPLRVGDRIVQVEIAATAEERSRGLMFRRALAPDSGMLFVFPRSRQLSFWMRNTAIPLDIGFFDSGGVLREIHPLEPFDERPVVSTSSDLRFALEVNRGWFSEHGIKPHATLDLEALAEILARRAGGQ